MLDRERRYPVRKSELLSTLRTNRELHVKEYESAMVEYRKNVLAELDNQCKLRAERAARIRDNLAIEEKDLLDFEDEHLVVPRTYSKQYDTVIGLLEMTTSELIEITSLDYTRFIDDDWEWKEEFRTSTMSYNSTTNRRD